MFFPIRGRRRQHLVTFASLWVTIVLSSVQLTTNSVIVTTRSRRALLEDDRKIPSVNNTVDITRRSLSHENFTQLEAMMDEWSMYANPELGQLFGGDIRKHPRGDKNRRTFLTDTRTRWPNGIVPYHLSTVIEQSKEAKEMLMNSMATISAATDNCIQFFPVTQEHIELYPRLIYINITGDRGGCTSDVGRVEHGGQLNLDVEQCFHLPGHSLHELLHALGQLHEHMRPDRDKFITIIWKNIRRDALDNFETIEDSESLSFGLPYDFDSITHYQRTAFATDSRLATIVPKNSTQTIGQRTHLSALDIKKLLLSYNCDKPKKPITFEQMLDSYKSDPNDFVRKQPDEYLNSFAAGDEFLKNDSLKFNILHSTEPPEPLEENVQIRTTDLPNLPEKATDQQSFSPFNTAQRTFTTLPTKPPFPMTNAPYEYPPPPNLIDAPSKISPVQSLYPPPAIDQWKLSNQKRSCPVQNTHSDGMILRENMNPLEVMDQALPRIRVNNFYLRDVELIFRWPIAQTMALTYPRNIPKGFVPFGAAMQPNLEHSRRSMEKVPSNYCEQLLQYRRWLWSCDNDNFPIELLPENDSR